ADLLDDGGQLARLVVHREQEGKAVAAGGLFPADDDEAGGVVAVGVDVGHQHLQPIEGGRLPAGDGRFGAVAAFGHELGGHGGVVHGGAGQDRKRVVEGRRVDV